MVTTKPVTPEADRVSDHIHIGEQCLRVRQAADVVHLAMQVIDTLDEGGAHTELVALHSTLRLVREELRDVADELDLLSVPKREVSDNTKGGGAQA